MYVFAREIRCQAISAAGRSLYQSLTFSELTLPVLGLSSYSLQCASQKHKKATSNFKLRLTFHSFQLFQFFASVNAKLTYMLARNIAALLQPTLSIIMNV